MTYDETPVAAAVGELRTALEDTLAPVEHQLERIAMSVERIAGTLEAHSGAHSVEDDLLVVTVARLTGERHGVAEALARLRQRQADVHLSEHLSVLIDQVVRDFADSLDDAERDAIRSRVSALLAAGDPDVELVVEDDATARR